MDSPSAHARQYRSGIGRECEVVHTWKKFICSTECMGRASTRPRPVMPGAIGVARVGARMSPKQRLAVRQVDSAPLLSDLRNWFVGHVITAEGVREAACR